MSTEIERKIGMPDGVGAEVAGNRVRINGPKGVLERNFTDPRYAKAITISKAGSEILVSSVSRKKIHRSVCGTIAAHIANMMRGASHGYRYSMKVFYTHFPISITVKGHEVQIRNFLGEKGARIAKIVGSADVKVEKDEIIITGADIEEVSQTAANIEQRCRLSRRDRRVFQDGIYMSGRSLQTGEAV